MSSSPSPSPSPPDIGVEEREDSRSVVTGSNPSVILHYNIFGTASDQAALTALGAHAPSTYVGLIRSFRDVTPIYVDVNNPDQCIWDGEAHYGARSSEDEDDPPVTGDSSFQFDTGGGRQHISQSKETMGIYPSGSSIGGAIGVTEDGNVEGVDILIPVYNFSETHYRDNAEITDNYKKLLAGMTARVNDGAFRGFAKGEVIFLGAVGSKRGYGDWEISYRFAMSPNLTGLKVGSITGIAKAGWHYMWVQYATDKDDARATKKPIAVYIERVYDLGTFAQLGIGV